MKYVIDKDGKIVLGSKGGIMIDPEVAGQEPYEMDVFGTATTLSELRTEAKTHRQKKSELQSILDSIPEPIRTNPKAAAEALATVASLGDKHKVDLERLKGELETSYKTASEANKAQIDKLNNQLFDAIVTSRFATSKALETTIFDKARPVAVSHFRNHFSVDENGNVIGKFRDGGTIYSKVNPGKPAEFDECIESIIMADPNKDSLLKPSGQKGGDSKGGQANGGGETKSSFNRIKDGLKSLKNQG